MELDVNVGFRDEHERSKRPVLHASQVIHRQIPETLPERAIDCTLAVRDDCELTIVQFPVCYRTRNRKHYAVSRACLSARDRVVTCIKVASAWFEQHDVTSAR